MITQSCSQHHHLSPRPMNSLGQSAFSFSFRSVSFFFVNVPLFNIFSIFLAGQEGFEPPTPGFGVRCSTVRATGLHDSTFQAPDHDRVKRTISYIIHLINECVHLVSLCTVCFLQNLQYLLNSSLSGVVRLFFVVV